MVRSGWRADRGLLRDEGDAVAKQPTALRRGDAQQILPHEAQGAAARGEAGRQIARHRTAEHGLACPIPRRGQAPAPRQEGDATQHLDTRRPARSRDGQILCLKHGHRPPRARPRAADPPPAAGPSPNRLKPSTAQEDARTGNTPPKARGTCSAAHRPASRPRRERSGSTRQADEGHRSPPPTHGDPHLQRQDGDDERQHAGRTSSPQDAHPPEAGAAVLPPT